MLHRFEPSKIYVFFPLTKVGVLIIIPKPLILGYNTTMNTFNKILINTLIANFTNNFVWMALTFWVFLETKSVLATSIVPGVYSVILTLSGFWFGSFVDNHKKKQVMLIASTISLCLFMIGLIIVSFTPEYLFTSISSIYLWILILLLICGVVVGNMRNIALSTLVTLLVPEKERDKANGLIGTVSGLAFAVTFVITGFALAYAGISGLLLITIAFTLVAILHLNSINIPEKEIIHTADTPQKMDIKGTILIISGIPGLFSLIFFNTINNFLGGIFNSLMDSYGLTVVPVQVWGILWGVFSLGSVLAGLIVAKKGVGTNALKSMLYGNLVMSVIVIFFMANSWIVLFAIGTFFWICLMTFIEAAEQTFLQKVVPFEHQGKVFGFAQTIEQSVSPFVAFLIGPIAEFVFIPFMTTGVGVSLIGGWFGVGVGRGIALIFLIAGIIGLIVSVIALKSKSYKLLSAKYLEK